MAARGEKCRSFDAIASTGQWFFLIPEKLYFSSYGSVRYGDCLTAENMDNFKLTKLLR
jgi:hypothetical protein